MKLEVIVVAVLVNHYRSIRWYRTICGWTENVLEHCENRDIAGITSAMKVLIYIMIYSSLQYLDS